MRYIKVFSMVCLGVILGTGCSQFTQDKTVLNVQNPSQILQEQAASFESSLELETELRDLFDADAETVTTGNYVYPVAHYTTLRQSVFGQYQGESYATGDHIVLSDNQTETPVYALATAKVMRAETVPGYGAVVILEFTEGAQTYHALYGYMDLDRLTTPIGQTLSQGAIIGYVAAGEPKHLFFSIYPYTGTELFSEHTTQDTDLSLWVNPADFLREHQAAEPVVITP